MTTHHSISIEYYRGGFWEGQVTDGMTEAEMNAHQDRYLDLVEQCIRNAVGSGVALRINDHDGTGALRIVSDIDDADRIVGDCFQQVFDSGTWFEPS